MTSPEECRQHFPDDPAITAEVGLLRRIPPWHFVADDNDGSYRPSSAAFEDDSDGDPMSVYCADVIEREGGQATRVMSGHEGFGLVSIPAGVVRQRDQTVHPKPLQAESSHAVVCGPKPKRTRRWFAQSSEWVVRPPK